MRRELAEDLAPNDGIRNERDGGEDGGDDKKAPEQSEDQRRQREREEDDCRWNGGEPFHSVA